jgi:hypothetical protein
MNTKQGWKFAVPELMTLDSKMLELCLRVHEEACGEAQRNDLSLGWPNDSLREAFAALTTEELAKPACVIHYAGHWHPGSNDWLRPLTRQGTYWRFSAYADETLRLALGIRRGQSSKRGFHFEVNDGVLKACAGTETAWIAQAIGYADRPTLEKAKLILKNSDVPETVPGPSKDKKKKDKPRERADKWFAAICDVTAQMARECSDDPFFNKWQETQ